MKRVKSPRRHRTGVRTQEVPEQTADVQEMRIRLEGRVERLEHARHELEALSSLLDDRWPRRLPWQVERVRLIADLPAIDEAMSALRALPQTHALAHSVEQSRRTLERLAGAAWSSLGDSPTGQSLDALLLGLLERAPIDIGYSTSAAGWPVGFTILAGTAALAFSQTWPVIIGCGLAVLASLLAWYFAPRRIWEMRSSSIVIRTPKLRELPFSAIERVEQLNGTVVVHHTEEGVRVQESLECDSPADLAALLTLHRARKVPRAADRREDAVVTAARWGEVDGAILAFARGVFFVNQNNLLRGFVVPPRLLLQELALLTDDALEALGASLDAGEFWPAGQCRVTTGQSSNERVLHLGQARAVTAPVTAEEAARLERWFA